MILMVCKNLASNGIMLLKLNIDAEEIQVCRKERGLSVIFPVFVQILEIRNAGCVDYSGSK